MLFDKEAWKAQCRENARRLETEINRLKSDYGDLLGLKQRQDDEFWAHARLISAMFKGRSFKRIGCGYGPLILRRAKR